MNSATLMREGRVTIPKAIRDHLKLRPGARIEFVIDEGGRVVLLPVSFDAADLAGIDPPPKRPVSLEAMESSIQRRSTRG